jgi:hypothetical protein
VALFALIGCHGDQPAPLYPTGTEKDDGHGELARASSKFLTAEGSDDGTGGEVVGQNVNAVDQYNMYGGDPYGGGIYGGGLYGGDPYGGYVGMQPWQYQPAVRVPHYDVQAGLTGEIEGTVSWSGAAPPQIKTACGTIDNPTLHVTEKGVGGAIVYIEKVRVGRNTQTYGRPAIVGGAISKHGCALMPAAQIVAPLPASFTVNGDSTKAKLVVTPPSLAAKSVELQEAGIASFEAQDGVTRVESDDGKLAPAWVIGLETPYYAITDDRGHFVIDQLAPGSYDVTIWQAPIATAGTNGAITYGQPIVSHRSVTVDSNKPAKLDVSLSASR